MTAGGHGAPEEVNVLRPGSYSDEGPGCDVSGISFGGGGRKFAVGGNVGGKLVVCGGIKRNNERTADCSAYNPETRTFESKGALSTPR